LTKEEALKLALETAEGFTNADWRKWKELASPDEFERWVKNRANHMIAIIKEALAQPAQEPEPDELTIAYMSGLLDGKKQRPWVGLTDEEIDFIVSTKCKRDLSHSDATKVAQAIETALRSKNT